MWGVTAWPSQMLLALDKQYRRRRPDGVQRQISLRSAWTPLRHYELALAWLRLLDDLGRAPRTLDAYTRGLAEFLTACDGDGADPLTATRADIAGYVRELRERPSRRGGNAVAIDSGSGLANTTIRQRLVPVRLFYDCLVEEGVPEDTERPLTWAAGSIQPVGSTLSF
jgi:hypothetical protein